MIGGGPGAFIGAVHRIAARMDNEYELVAGVFSSKPELSALSGEEIGLDASSNLRTPGGHPEGYLERRKR